MIAALIAIAVTAANADAAQQLAAMPLMPKNLAPETAQILDLLLVAELENVGHFAVVRPADVDAMLGLERLKDAVGCDDVSCATDLAAALGVQLLMTGTAGKLGDELVLQLTLIDVGAQRVRHRGEVTVPADERSYHEAVRRAVAQVLELAAPEPTGTSLARLTPVTLRFGTQDGRAYDVKVVTSDGLEHVCNSVAGTAACTLNGLALGDARLYVTSEHLEPLDRKLDIEDRKETVVFHLQRGPGLGSIIAWTYGGVALAAGIALLSVGAATHQKGFVYGGVPAAAVGGLLIGLGFTFDGQVMAPSQKLREDGSRSWWPF